MHVVIEPITVTLTDNSNELLIVTSAAQSQQENGTGVITINFRRQPLPYGETPATPNRMSTQDKPTFYQAVPEQLKPFLDTMEKAKRCSL